MLPRCVQCCHDVHALLAPRPAEALAEENALKAILEITVAYEELMLAHKKEVHCTVITAHVSRGCGVLYSGAWGIRVAA